jgi:hypothetical protein
MAGTFSPTGSSGNLTRLELEQLRRGDFFAGGKALTVGDDGTVVGGVGVGSVNAEPYVTSPGVALDDVYPINPPAAPGTALQTLVQSALTPSEAVRWYGVDVILVGTAGRVVSTTSFQDTSGVNFSLLGVQAGDIVLFQSHASAAGSNAWAVGTVATVLTTVLGLSNINNPTFGVTTTLDSSNVNETWNYVVVRPNVVQLFAIPGSGPVGREQTFLAVKPGSTLHGLTAPTLDQINADRVANLVPPRFSASASVDRADAVFAAPGPRQSADKIGYRIVLYRSNAAGTAPDLTAPIASLNPVLDSTIPASDQRMTVDYKSGAVRFSCAPRAGDDIKPTGGNGGVNTTTGRLQLYAVFFAIDQTLTQGASRSVVTLRSSASTAVAQGSFGIKGPARVRYDATRDVWELGAAPSGQNNFVVRALGSVEDADQTTRFGVLDATNSVRDPFRGFVYRSAAGKGNAWKFVQRDLPATGHPESSRELALADKTALTVGDGTSPRLNPGADHNPDPGTGKGHRPSGDSLLAALKSAATEGYGVVHLRRGRFTVNQTVFVPPGVVLEGEGYGTVVCASYSSTAQATPTVFQFGPNTPWGVYDMSWNGVNVTPSAFTYPDLGRVEGYDIVWNPARRVWGIVQGDVTGKAIWFNEMRTDGTFVLPGLGIDLKASATNLYTSSSPNGITVTPLALTGFTSQHTPGHYPRIDCNSTFDEYAVVWVEEQTVSGVIGPRTKLQVVTSSPTAGPALKFGATVDVVPPAGSFFTHPSIACDFPSDGTSAYTILVTGWAYDPTLTTTLIVTRAFGSAAGNQLGITNGFTSLSSYSVVSSTDIETNGRFGAAVVYTVRKHPLYVWDQGDQNATSAEFSASTFISNWATGRGVEAGSRFVHLGAGPSASAGDQTSLLALKGRTGIFRGFKSGSPGTAYVQFDNLTPNTFNYTNVNASAVRWAVAPCVRMFIASVSTEGGVAVSAATQIAGPPTSTTTGEFYLTEREPDYARIVRGSEGRFLVVYQGLDTNGAVNRATGQFFLSRSTAAIDTVAMASNAVYREYIATCRIVLEQTATGLVVVGPSVTQGASFTAPTGQFGAILDPEVIARGINGVRVEIPFANGENNSDRVEWDISARNRVFRYGSSLLPGATWSGSDWTVVSPGISSLQSDTGVWVVSGGRFFLRDASVYFGQGAQAPTADGIHLRMTVRPGDVFLFPSVGGGTVAVVLGVTSEREVEFATNIGLSNGTTGVSWTIISQNGSLGVPSGAKNLGFRIAPDGRVITTSSALTHADSPNEDVVSGSGYFLPRQETMYAKGTWGDLTNPAGPNGLAFGRTTNQWNDLVEGSRLMADVGFKGVAIGAPKPFAEPLSLESPLVALAWGENFFAAVDRHVGGTSRTVASPVDAPVNRVVAYRQSFGPYRSGLRALRVEGGGTEAQSKVLTKRHVFTRHGPPLAGSAFLATDGYRNAHVHVAVSSVEPVAGGGDPFTYTLDPFDNRSYQAFAETVQTDAIGDHPVRTRLASATITGQPRDTATFLNRRREGQTGKSVWTGKEFLSVVSTDEGLVVLAHGGDDGDGSFGDELLGETSQGIMYRSRAVATIGLANHLGGKVSSPKVKVPTVGSGACSLDSTYVRDLIIYDIAWSGTSLAIIWTAGYLSLVGDGSGATNPANSELTDIGGSGVGVAVVTFGLNLDYPQARAEKFNPRSTVNAVNYTLRLASTKNEFRDPYILWDGKQFVFTYLEGKIVGTGVVKAGSMPAEGFSSRSAIKYARPFNGLTGQHVKALGKVSASGDGTLIPLVTLQVGDVVVIARTVAANGSSAYTETRNTLLNGTYIVQDVNPGDINVSLAETGKVNLGIDLSGGGFFNGFLVYGAAYQGGVTTSVALSNDTDYGGHNPFNPDDNRPVANGPNQAVTGVAAFALHNWGFVYNAQDDEYTVAFTNPTNQLVLQTFGKGGQPSRTMMVGTFTTLKDASLAWNGSEYFLALVDQTGSPAIDRIRFSTFSRTLTPKQALVPVDDKTTLVGSGPGQKPGPGYRYDSLVHTDIAKIRRISARWNGKLCRWVLCASVAWYHEPDMATVMGLYKLTPPLAQRSGTITAWSNRTLTPSVSNDFANMQGGQRVISIRTATTLSSLTPRTNSGDDPPGASSQSILPGPTTNAPTYVGGYTIQSTAQSFTSVLKNHVVEFKNRQRLRVAANTVRVGGTTDVIFLEGGIFPQITASESYTFSAFSYTKQLSFNLNDPGTVPTDPIAIDVHTGDVTDPTRLTSTSGSTATLGALYREDVWVWTIGSTSPALRAVDADDVSIESVEVTGGSTDVEERSRVVARPHVRMNGQVFGSVNDAATTPDASFAFWGPRPHSVLVAPTPRGKTDGLRFANYRSRTPVRHDPEKT